MTGNVHLSGQATRLAKHAQPSIEKVGYLLKKVRVVSRLVHSIPTRG
jgi:hypothetical protein